MIQFHLTGGPHSDDLLRSLHPLLPPCSVCRGKKRPQIWSPGRCLADCYWWLFMLPCHLAWCLGWRGVVEHCLLIQADCGGAGADWNGLPLHLLCTNKSKARNTSYGDNVLLLSGQPELVWRKRKNSCNAYFRNV